MEILTAIRKKNNNLVPRKLNSGTSSVVQIPIKSIKSNPNQPRRYFSSDNLKELSESIRIYGVIQPITVRKTGNGLYELISGERRVRASVLAGLMRVPAIVVGISNIDSALVALIENVQRCDLSFLEEANAYYKLLNDFGYTQEQLAIKLGKNQSTIANKVRLLKLQRAVRTIIDEHGLTERHARALLRLPDADSQFRALDIILEKTLNVKQTDDLIEKMIGDDASCRKSKNHIPRVKDVRIFSNTIKKAVEIMNRSGKNCVSNEQEYDDRFEYNIKIYK